MIKTFTSFILCFVFTLGVMSYSKSAYALDSKIKVLASTSVYGASGGALLGFASMAFGTSARAIAKGASLGLYAGIIFGTYIIVSHYYRPQYETPYEDSDSPYESGDGAPYDSKKSLNAAPEEQQPQLHERAFQINEMKLNFKSSHQVPPMYLEIIRYTF
ncbi:MAG: hypothetical protein ACOYL6_14105 [Bacteriovoracaceae bacterium]